MKNENFELLLAMMRLLKSEDAKSASIEDSIISIINNFRTYLDEKQKKQIDEEFKKYVAKIKKKKIEEQAMKRNEEETYREAVDDFVIEEMNF